MYEYRATVISVVDGDTVLLSVDLGFLVSYRHSCRLFGINAPEHKTPTGDAATAYLTALLPAGTVLTLRTQKDKFEKYGRILGTLILADGRVVNDLLVAEHHAMPWDGKGGRPELVP